MKEANTFQYADLFGTIQLFISLAALAVIVWIFLHFIMKKNDSSVNSENQKDNCRSKWIHTLYIGGIATFIILEFIVYVVLNNDQKDNIIDTISFGATLSSLIMSVVAIIFTIVHGRNGESQLGQITQATEELKTTANSLVKFKDMVTDIDKHIDDFNTQVSNSIGNLSQSINEKIANLNSAVAEMTAKTREIREHQIKVQEQTKEGTSTTSNSTFTVSHYLMSGSYIGALTMLICSYSKQESKKVDFKSISEVFDGTSLDYVYGYIISSCACGVLDIYGDFPELTATKITNGLGNACVSKIKNFLKATKPEYVDGYVSRLNVIADYFGKSKFNKEDLLK